MTRRKAIELRRNQEKTRLEIQQLKRELERKREKRGDPAFVRWIEQVTRRNVALGLQG